jgi:hypothetical protein
LSIEARKTLTLPTKRNASKTTGLRQALLLINIVGKAWRANAGSPPNLNSLHFRLLRKGEGVIFRASASVGALFALSLPPLLEGEGHADDLRFKPR